MRLLASGLPLPGRQLTCTTCGGPMVFARTMASPTGTGGKPMPLDVMPDPDGNVAVREAGRGLVCRVLGKDEGHDTQAEVLAMPHFASCKARAAARGPAPAAPGNVIDFAAARGRRTPRGTR